VVAKATGRRRRSLAEPVFAAFAVVSALPPVSGCSSNDAPTGSDPAVHAASGGSDGNQEGPYDGGDPASLVTPATQFARDVLPVFRGGCGFSGCHGDSRPTAPLVFLYASSTDATPVSAIGPQVYSTIVDKKSLENPSMNYVTPGDPTNSYLMRKLDGALTDIASQCPTENALYTRYGSSYAFVNGCGGQMPEGLTPLDATSRDTIRRWIAQGALEN
jgi:hypothetical protein